MGKASRSKRERRHATLAGLSNGLRDQLERGDFRIQSNPPGRKLSEKLLELIRPELEDDGSIEAHRSLVSLAATAWNLALLDPEEVEQKLSRLGDELEEEGGLLAEAFLRTLIERKRWLFPDDLRVVARWEVEDRGRDCRLVVASLG